MTKNGSCLSRRLVDNCESWYLFVRLAVGYCWWAKTRSAESPNCSSDCKTCKSPVGAGGGKEQGFRKRRGYGVVLDGELGIQWMTRWRMVKLWLVLLVLGGLRARQQLTSHKLNSAGILRQAYSAASHHRRFISQPPHNPGWKSVYCMGYVVAVVSRAL